jgi:very-short-patch-repair endonuclease
MRQTDLSEAMARAGRRDMPLADRMLGQALRDRRFLGLRMRGQVPPGGAVFAFFCAERRLVIDLDRAPDHCLGRLARQGFRVLRLDLAALRADPASSLARIAAACRQRIDPHDPI